METAMGAIKLTNVSGSVVAESTNGDIEVVLSRVAPGKPMSFVTFNGAFDITLPADTKASLRIKSNMGEVFSDFDIALKTPPVDAEKTTNREGGKFRLNLDRAVFGTINGGGPEFKFENFNGNIYLRKKK
ncbi:MAG: DUF4097 family beta strand repeat-containing protein [Candidatus Aminicenantes bacterium]|nr:DUF4097 family beta strand repeat-containing protein [Candidatus Aminicenantes bacterium]